MTRNLFVYGTLMKATGQPAAMRLAGEAEFVGFASARGVLYDLLKWPGFIASQRAVDRVHGEVWRLRDRASLVWLDDYEGITAGALDPEYDRIATSVRRSDGRCIRAMLYAYRRPLAGAPRIASGRWLDRSPRFAPSLGELTAAA